jgi:predicted metal-binding membrane protein
MPLSSGDLAIAGGLLATAAAAWVATILRMAGMAAGLWSHPADPALFAGTWVAMMTAMMLPSIVPAAIVAGRAVRSRRGLRTAAFAGGYLAVWCAAGLVPFALLRAAGPLLSGGAGRLMAGGVLLAAAAYQLGPPKRACLRRLCAPFPFAGDAGRRGMAGPLRAGVEIGAWCLACGCALMASLFALGMMSATWMVVVWVLVMAERLLPPRRHAAVAVAAVLAALAVAVLAGAPEMS